jgi:NDP-sugar pyrophosphorylase family protein
MVLAAGLGSRLRPYTDSVPKPLFPVLGVPAIEWALAGLRSAGVTDAVVNLHHLPAPIVRRLGAGEGVGVRLSYSDEPVILGTGGGLSAVRSFFDGEAAFVLHNGDAFTDYDLAALVAGHLASGAAFTLALADPPDRPEARLVELDGDRVVGIRGRPASRGGTAYVFSGISVLSPAVFDFLPPGEASCLVERGLVPMMEAGLSARGVVQRGLFCDIGTADRYLDLQWDLLPRAEALFASRGLEPPSPLLPGLLARGVPSIEPDVTVFPGVLVCDGAVVRSGATLGPRAVVCGGAVVEAGAVVSDAVVFPGAVARGEARGIVV